MISVSYRGRAFEKLKALSRSIYGTDETFRHRVLRAGAEELFRRVIQGFDSSRDPYGKRWAPIASGRRRPLIRTGRLMASWSYAIGGMAFSLRSSAWYAALHQRGRGRIPQRKMIPQKNDTQKAWGGAVGSAMSEAAAEYIRLIRSRTS